jgi:exoribonuclease II
MPHVLFEEDGSFKAGSVMSETGTSLQVEHASGRRAKIKTGHVMLRFDQPAPGDLLAAAQKQANDIEIDFLWECAPQDEFAFLDLALEYYGHRPNAVEATGLLLKLHSAPVYFHRKGRGRYRPAPSDVLKSALAGVERKRQQELQIESDSQALIEGRLPEAFSKLAPQLLVNPDKQSLEYRALERASERSHRTPERLLLAAGAFDSPHALHRARFVAEFFPHGTGFPAQPELPQPDKALPLSGVEAFSIDDSTTTEIDDCLSVTRLPEGGLRVGVHIAAPGVVLHPGDALDALARERMSTVYMPGEKITMLPDRVVAEFSLDEGREVAALSLYVDLDADGTRIIARSSRLERIRVAANLRHDQLDDLVTEASLADPAVSLPFGDALRVLWKLTLACTAERERVRGKPEPRFRSDFNFYVDGDQVRIVQRRRDAPLDRIVAEMMILANSEWGLLLADHQVPGIYRSQQAGRVRTSTHPLPHQGLGVSQYMWTSSPLRRYVDLVNQRQLLAVLAGEKPPFGANDAELFSVMTAFDARYAAYAEFQTRMERYWCLRWLAQQKLTRVEAVVVRDDMVRLADAPFYFRLADVPTLAAGRRILIEILDSDEIGLDLSARFVSVVGAAGTDAAAAGEPRDETAIGAAGAPADEPDAAIETESI